MKKRTLSLIVPVLILALTVSAMTILPATSQDTNLIVDKLKELDSKLEGENPVLQNKVRAVIHQIESGALNGALNKLQNDVKKSIIARVASPEELIKLIDEIIDLIKGITPPPPQNPDFEITTPPYSLDVVQGGFNTTIIMITSLNNFNAEVALSAVTSAPEVIITLDPNTLLPLPNATATSTLRINATQTATPGDYVINVTGTSSTLEHTVAIPLRIIRVTPPPPTPDFTITASQTTLTIEQGDAANSTITVASLGGFSAAVDLTLTPESIAGATLSLNATQITPPPDEFITSMLKIEIANDASPSEYNITVTGTSGTLQHSVNVSFTIIIERKPPMIVSVSQIPRSTPAYNETVTILANIVDPESGVKNATLRYFRDTAQQDILMTLSAGLYEATIPAYSFGTVIEYSVHCYDNAGNSASSNRIPYTVADPYRPLMGAPTWAPQEPLVNDSIVVNVTVTEPEDASGIDTVILRYSNATGTYSTSMTDRHDGNWTAVISNQTGPKVAFIVEAVDKAGNEIESDIHEFNVATPAFPLVWILAAIAILAAATGGGAYYVRRKKKKSTAATPVPSAPTKPISQHLP